MKCNPVSTLAASAMFALLASLALATTIIVPEPPRPGVRAAPAVEMKSFSVDATIRGQIAVTRIEQILHNPGRSPAEATLLFPLPLGAHLDSFTMTIDGVDTPAELLDAGKARKIYEDIVRSMKDPALLEFVGRGVYKARVFPIDPGADKRIVFRYTQVLPADTGIMEYRAPLGARAPTGSSGDTSTAVRVRIEAEGPVGAVYSPSHSIEVSRPSKSVAVAGFETSGGADAGSGDDFRLFFSTQPDADESIGLSLMPYRPDTDEDGYFLLIATPMAHELEQDGIVEQDVVFVLDTSGSMRGEKIRQAKDALRFCIENLNPGDRFEIVRFATDVQPFFGELTPNTKESRAKAAAFIETLTAVGGTAIDESLRTALAPLGSRAEKDRPYIIIFMTDGQPTVGERNKDRIVANLAESLGDRSVRVFCFGVGYDVNTHLLDDIAGRTRAVSQYVSPSEDIELTVSRFYAKISDPVLSNVELEFDGDVRAAMTYPRALPDLFHGDQLIVLGRYTGAGDVRVRISGDVNGERVTFEREAKFPDQFGEHEFIAPLWATRRIGFLLDAIRLHGKSDELGDEIAMLARRYGIVTPYTSYLILEDEQQRGVPAAAQTFRDRDVSDAITDGNYGPARMRQEQTGHESVEAARSIGELQQAHRRAGSANAQLSYAAAGSRATVQTRYVQGRAFFQNGDTWVDTSAQSIPDAPRTRIRFDSDAYYELLVANPEAAQWLAIGRNVEVVMNDVVYEIHDGDDEEPND